MALNGGKSTFLSNDSTFVSPSTCFHLTSHILHVTHVRSSLAFSLSLPLSFSPQIIANHHMQSISFASGGDPVSHPTLSPSLLTQISLWTFSIFLQPAYPSFLSSVIVYSYEYHSLQCCLDGLQSSSKPDPITSCHLSFSSAYVFNFCYDLQLCFISFLFFFQLLYPIPALYFFLIDFSCSPPPLTVFPCLCQDTAEYVAYVAKDPVNQRGEK